MRTNGESAAHGCVSVPGHTSRADLGAANDAAPPAREAHPAPPLRVSGLTVAYADRIVLRDVSFELPTGTMTAIIGPNGAGKSTALKAVLGIVPPVKGEVALFGERLNAARDRIAYVPQRASVDWDFPARALDVVLMGLYREVGLFRRMGAQRRARAMDYLERVGMAEFADRQIGRLSGGQQQRVFLARALAQDAQLLLLDEPLAGVDAATERAVVDVLRTLRDEKRTLAVVHHDLSTVTAYFDRVVLLNGRTVAEGPVATAFTGALLRETYGGRLAALPDLAT